MNCPACRAECPEGSDVCPACGVIFAKWSAKVSKAAGPDFKDIPAMALLMREIETSAAAYGSTIQRERVEGAFRRASQLPACGRYDHMAKEAGLARPERVPLTEADRMEAERQGADLDTKCMVDGVWKYGGSMTPGDQGATERLARGRSSRQGEY